MNEDKTLGMMQLKFKDDRFYYLEKTQTYEDAQYLVMDENLYIKKANVQSSARSPKTYISSFNYADYVICCELKRSMKLEQHLFSLGYVRRAFTVESGLFCEFSELTLLPGATLEITIEGHRISISRIRSSKLFSVRGDVQFILNDMAQDKCFETIEELNNEKHSQYKQFNLSSKYADKIPIYTTNISNAKFHVRTLTDFRPVNEVKSKDDLLTITICVIAGCFTGIILLFSIV